MAQGISVHIGLNRVDPAQYEGWDGQLAACEADAKDMEALAKAQGFKIALAAADQGRHRRRRDGRDPRARQRRSSRATSSF